MKNSEHMSNNLALINSPEHMSNNLVLINSPNTYSLTHIKFSFWSASTTNLNSLPKSFRLVEMNEKLLTSVMKPVIYPMSLLNTPLGKQNTLNIKSANQDNAFSYLITIHRKHGADVIKLCKLIPFLEVQERRTFSHK
jgi:hypothetical protein